MNESSHSRSVEREASHRTAGSRKRQSLPEPNAYNHHALSPDSKRLKNGTEKSPLKRAKFHGKAQQISDRHHQLTLTQGFLNKASMAAQYRRRRLLELANNGSSNPEAEDESALPVSGRDITVYAAANTEALEDLDITGPSVGSAEIVPGRGDECFPSSEDPAIYADNEHWAYYEDDYPASDDDIDVLVRQRTRSATKRQLSPMPSQPAYIRQTKSDLTPLIGTTGLDVDGSSSNPNWSELVSSSQPAYPGSASLGSGENMGNNPPRAVLCPLPDLAGGIGTPHVLVPSTRAPTESLDGSETEVESEVEAHAPVETPKVAPVSKRPWSTSVLINKQVPLAESPSTSRSRGKAGLSSSKSVRIKREPVTFQPLQLRCSPSRPRPGSSLSDGKKGAKVKKEKRQETLTQLKWVVKLPTQSLEEEAESDDNSDIASPTDESLNSQVECDEATETGVGQVQSRREGVMAPVIPDSQTALDVVPETQGDDFLLEERDDQDGSSEGEIIGIDSLFSSNSIDQHSGPKLDKRKLASPKISSSSPVIDHIPDSAERDSNSLNSRKSERNGPIFIDSSFDETTALIEELLPPGPAHQAATILDSDEDGGDGDGDGPGNGLELVDEFLWPLAQLSNEGGSVDKEHSGHKAIVGTGENEPKGRASARVDSNENSLVTSASLPEPRLNGEESTGEANSNLLPPSSLPPPFPNQFSSPGRPNTHSLPRYPKPESQRSPTRLVTIAELLPSSIGDDIPLPPYL